MIQFTDVSAELPPSESKIIRNKDEAASINSCRLPFCLLLLIFYTEAGSSTFMRNVGEVSTRLHGFTSKKTVFYTTVFSCDNLEYNIGIEIK